MDTYAEPGRALFTLLSSARELEERAAASPEYSDISSNDLHVIRAVGRGEPKNMSAIAKELSVTVGTLTIAMNGLVKKGYVLRERGKKDRRVVYISLSEKGRGAYEYYEEFYRRTAVSVLENLTPEELRLLMQALCKLCVLLRRAEKEE